MHNDSPMSSKIRRSTMASACVALTSAVVSAGAGVALAAGDQDTAAASAAAAKVDMRTFAIINGSTGAVGESDGHVLTSQRLGDELDGRLYRITFDRDIRQCGFVATPTAFEAGDLVNADTGIAIRQDRSFEKRQVVDVTTKDGGEDFLENDSSSTLLLECR